MNDRTLYNVVKKEIFWIVKSVQNWMRTYEDNENPQRAYGSKKAEYYEWKLNRKNMKASKIVKNDGLSEIKDKQELLKRAKSLLKQCRKKIVKWIMYEDEENYEHFIRYCGYIAKWIKDA